MTIPSLDEQLPESPIPPTVVEIPQPEEPPEAKPFLISFERYNTKECQLDGMDNKMARKTLQVIRDIGVNIKDESDFSKHLPKLAVIPIANNGDYRKLYKGLTDMPDVEVKEAKIDRDKGRLFFFLVGKIFHVDSHYQT